MTATGLRITTAASLDALAGALAERLGGTAEDPFRMPLVCADDAGTSRWLSYALGHRLGAREGHVDGIRAGVELVPLRGWLSHLTEGASGDDLSLAARIITAVGDAADEPWVAMLEGLISSDVLPGQRWATARRVAGLFQRYRRYRPGLLDRWLAGDDTGPDGAALPPDHSWQPPLWRAVATHDEASTGGDVGIFAPGSVSVAEHAAVRRLAQDHRVEVYLFDPLPSIDATASGARRPVPARHRLNARLARSGWEARSGWLSGADEITRIDVEPPSGTSQLGALRRDLAADAAEPTRRAPDGSITVHACHGPDRQVDVLREALVDSFANDPTLEPRDVVIRCADPERYAPLLMSAFGPGARASGHPAAQLRVEVSDQSLRQLNPVLGVLEDLLVLANARVTRSQVLSLVGRAPVRQRFGIDADAWDRLGTLTADAGIRWGLDGAHHDEYGVLDAAGASWAAGVDRLALGLALPDEGTIEVSGVIPADDVSDRDAEFIGIITRVHDLLTDLRRLGRRPRSASEWREWCQATLRDWCVTSAEDGWQLTHAHAVVSEALTLPADAPPLGIGDLRVVLADAFAGRPPRSRFGSGSLVVCGPGQLRHVPHRVTAVLGVDDGTFPRPARTDGDDLLALAPQAGDPDRRADDRQFLHDAITSCTEQLIVCHARFDERTNEPRPPSVPVAELIETVAQMSGALTESGSGDIAAVETRHALQPFAPGEFAAPLRNYDSIAAAGARALAGPSGPAPATFAPEDLPDPGRPTTLALDDLVSFLKNPCAHLLRARGGLPPQEESADDDAIALELDGLDRWKIGSRVLTNALSGGDIAVEAGRERGRGHLPPGRLGDDVVQQVHNKVADIVRRRSTEIGSASPEYRQLSIDADRCLLTGSATTVGQKILDVTYSGDSARAQLGGWVTLLAVTATAPDTPWQWCMVGGRETTTLGPVRPDWAVRTLSNLVDLYHAGTIFPLPLPAHLGREYARRSRSRDVEDPYFWKGLDREWSDHCAADTALRTFYPDLDALRAVPPRPGDSATHREPTRFGTLALRLWRPLMAAESRDDR